MFKLGSVVVDYKTDEKPFIAGNEKVKQGLKDVEKQAGENKKAFSIMGDTGTRTAGLLAGAGGLGLIAAGFKQLFDSARNFNNELDKGLNNAKNKLALNAEETKMLGDVAKEVYVNNYGESIADVTEQMGVMMEQMSGMRRLSTDDMKLVAQSIMNISSVTGESNDRIAQSADTLSKKFGLSITESLAMINQGFQKGLNKSGDFLDTIGEYSIQFQEAGASVDDFFGLMQGGLESGMLGTDKAADMFKEFNIRIKDGSDATADALKAINLSNITDELKNGSITGTDAFKKILDAVIQIDDPVKKSQVGVALLGTQFEDLGQSTDSLIGIVSSMGPDGFDRSKESLEGLGASSTDTEDKLASAQRQFQVLSSEALKPLTEEFNKLMLKILEFAMPLMQNKDLMYGLAIVIGIVTIAIALFSLIMAISLIPTMWAAAVAGWAMVAPFMPLILIFMLVIGVVALLWYAFNNNIFGIKDIVNNVFGWIMNTAVPWVQNAFNNLLKGAESLKNSVVNTFNGIKDGIGSAMKFAVNMVIDQVNRFLDGINLIIKGANMIPGVSIPQVGKIPRFERGTNGYQGMATINEKGAEALRVGDTVYFPERTQVFTNTETQKMMSGDNQANININIQSHTFLDDKNLDELMKRAKNAAKRNGFAVA